MDAEGGDEEGGDEVQGKGEGEFEDTGEGAESEGVGAGVDLRSVTGESFGAFAGDEELAAGAFARAVVEEEADESEDEEDANKDPSETVGLRVPGVKVKEVDKKQRADKQAGGNGFDAEHEESGEHRAFAMREFTGTVMLKNCKNAGLQLQKGQYKRSQYDDFDRGDNAHD